MMANACQPTRMLCLFAIVPGRMQMRSLSTLISLNHPAASGLGHLILQRYTVQDSSVAQARQVESLIAPVQKQFAEAAADRRSLHKPLA